MQGDPPYVLASDNAYLYTNLHERRAGATYGAEDQSDNLSAIDRMVGLAGGVTGVIPGHDPLPFRRFPTRGRVATIRTAR